jgi:death-on-curing family protein
MTKYVNKRMIVAINKMSIELTGGIRFAGKNNLIRGSRLDFVDRINKNKVFGTVEFKDIFHQAAAYMYYILKNHPFIDGNKRTALASTITFLQWNKCLFSPLDEDAVFVFVKYITKSTASPKDTMKELSSWLRSMCLY